MKAKSWQTSFKNHLLRFNIVASSSVPWIYLGQFWHTLQEDGSKYKLKFVLDRKFLEMAPFFLNTLGFTLELRSPFSLKTTGLVQPWQTLGKIFARCLITRATGHDQPPLQIMQILSWMITDEMKLTKHYQMYDAVFGVDVPTTQSQLIESTQGTHRITSAPRSPNPDVDEAGSSAPRKSTVIRLRIPP
ncbi:hypothetical protein Tco_0481335, partial [Tanacetum coccineum]